MFTMLKADRGGLTIDPKVGFHRNVAELDFTSMFPWLIYNHNISVECMLSNDGPLDPIPHLPVTVSLQKKGLIPRALKPFIGITRPVVTYRKQVVRLRGKTRTVVVAKTVTNSQTSTVSQTQTDVRTVTQPVTVVQTQTVTSTVTEPAVTVTVTVPTGP